MPRSIKQVGKSDTVYHLYFSKRTMSPLPPSASPTTRQGPALPQLREQKENTEKDKGKIMQHR